MPDLDDTKREPTHNGAGFPIGGSRSAGRAGTRERLTLDLASVVSYHA